MALEIEGKLIKILPEVTGEGNRGPWTKQEFVIETFGEYPKKVCFLAWNEKATEIKNYAMGSVLKVTFSAESREYNERWYTDLRAFRFGPIGAGAAGVQSTSAPQTNTAPPPIEPPTEEEEGDDLPF